MALATCGTGEASVVCATTNIDGLHTRAGERVGNRVEVAERSGRRPAP